MYICTSIQTWFFSALKRNSGSYHYDSFFIVYSRAPTTFKLEGEVTSLSGSSQGEVGDNREKWEDFWEKLIAINQNIVSRPLWRYPAQI